MDISDFKQRTELINTARDMAVQDIQRRVARDHIDYVMGESDTTLTVDAMDTDAVLTVLQELSAAGYTVDSHADDFVPSVLFLTPRLHDELRCETDTYRRTPHDEPRTVAEADVYADATLPDGTGLLVHPNAIIPTPPRNIDRPWDVRDPEGVIVVQVVGWD